MAGEARARQQRIIKPAQIGQAWAFNRQNMPAMHPAAEGNVSKGQIIATKKALPFQLLVHNRPKLARFIACLGFRLPIAFRFRQADMGKNMVTIGAVRWPSVQSIQVSTVALWRASRG